MNTVARLLISYLVIFLIFWLAVAGLGGAVGPVELFILVGVAVVAAVFRTRKVLQTRSVTKVVR